MSGRFGVSLRIAASSSPVFATWRTVSAALVLSPIIASAFLVAVAASVASPDLRATVYASVLVTAASTTMATVTGMVSMDRRLGVVEEIFSRSLFAPVFWLGKLVISTVSSAIVATISALAIFAIDPQHSTLALTSCLAVLPGALMVGALVGASMSIVSMTLQDPYLLTNVVALVIPFTAGVMAPLASYPRWLAACAHFLPLTGLIAAFRTLSTPETGTAPVMFDIGNEALITVAWVLLAVCARNWVAARIRSGALTRDI